MSEESLLRERIAALGHCSICADTRMARLETSVFGWVTKFLSRQQTHASDCSIPLRFQKSVQMERSFPVMRHRRNRSSISQCTASVEMHAALFICIAHTQLPSHANVMTMWTM